MNLDRILIIGATSAIAEAIGRQFAMRGATLCLTGRDISRLDVVANDFEVRCGSPVHRYVFDVEDFAHHEDLLAEADLLMGGIDVVLIAHGTLPDPVQCAKSVKSTLKAIEINALSVISLMTLAAHRFEQKNWGTIAVISSVAGDRGRGSNYVYGSAKAMVSAFASGLGQSLRKTRVRVVNIKPGFVDTPMTANVPKNMLWAQPEQVALQAVRAIDAGQPVVYVPGFWYFIMGMVKAVPEWLFRRLPL